VGYEQASLNQIIAAAGWGKSSFYHYFPDKRRLHDHVVLTLRERVEKDLVVPDLKALDADTFWSAMAVLLDSLTRAAVVHPEALLLGRMFHHPPAARGPDGQLTKLRSEVADWIARAVQRGQRLHVVRADLPSDLIAELSVAVLSSVDRWNLYRGDAEPVGPWDAIGLLWDAVGAGRQASLTPT
jgi:AcrR family transcriptional regulator